jgi:hypothetical protein
MTNRDKHASYDQAVVGAASLRGAVRGEILPITVTTSSKPFLVPESWKGLHIRMIADGGDVYYQISTTTTVACDIAARAVETGGPPAALTPSASGNGCIPIFNKTPVDVPFGTDAVSFALIGSAPCVLRCHIAET